MSRYVSVTLLFAALAALVGAQGTSGPNPAEQARMLRRNSELLKATDNSSLDLTEKYTAFERAGTCNGLVKVWAGAVVKAMNDGDAARAAEFGEHLNKVADRGVADNLRLARKTIPANSPSEQDLYRLRDDAKGELDKVDAAIREQSSLQPLRKSLAESSAHIESATKK